MPPPTITHNHPPPTTSQNISSTTHHQPKYIYHYSPPPTDSQNFFIRKSYMILSIIFTTFTRNDLKRLQCEQTFILCETSLVFKKDKCLSVENILVLKFDKAIFKETIELITSIIRNSLIKCPFNCHAVFSNSDRRRLLKKSCCSQK